MGNKSKWPNSQEPPRSYILHFGCLLFNQFFGKKTWKLVHFGPLKTLSIFIYILEYQSTTLLRNSKETKWDYLIHFGCGQNIFDHFYTKNLKIKLLGYNSRKDAIKNIPNFKIFCRKVKRETPGYLQTRDNAGVWNSSVCLQLEEQGIKNKKDKIIEILQSIIRQIANSSRIIQLNSFDSWLFPGLFTFHHLFLKLTKQAEQANEVIFQSQLE